jgi:hypothetical protein
LNDLTTQVAQSGVNWAGLKDYTPQPIPVVKTSDDK